jgi:tartrate dehydratase alpha subunit/fumarate hydratase class I-like protein
MGIVGFGENRFIFSKKIDLGFKYCPPYPVSVIINLLIFLCVLPSQAQLLFPNDSNLQISGEVLFGSAIQRFLVNRSIIL